MNDYEDDDTRQPGWLLLAGLLGILSWLLIIVGLRRVGEIIASH